MKMPIITLMVCSTFCSCLTLIQAQCVAAATDPAVCSAAQKTCNDNFKDSPNDIDREQCSREYKECLSRSAEEFRIDQEQLQKEQAVKDQAEKNQWESQGLSPEEQRQEMLKKEQEGYERREAEEQDRVQKAEEERLRKLGEEAQQPRDKAEQDQKDNDSFNSLKMYQLK